MKSNWRQRLGEDVYKLILTLSVMSCNYLRLNLFSNIITVDFDMFSSFIENWIRHNMQSTWFSQQRDIGWECKKLKSSSNAFTYISSEAMDAIVQYPISVLKQATTNWFLLFHETKFSLTNIQYQWSICDKECFLPSLH